MYVEETGTSICLVSHDGRILNEIKIEADHSGAKTNKQINKHQQNKKTIQSKSLNLDWKHHANLQQ